MTATTVLLGARAGWILVADPAAAVPIGSFPVVQ